MPPRLPATKTLASLLLLTTVTSPPVDGSPYIVNGNDAAPNSVLSIASLQADGHHFCGGSLIAPSWIVTAAHCVRGVSTVSDDYYKAVLGEHDLNTNSGKEQKVGWKRVILHPRYTGEWGGDDHYNNDIALIELRDPVTLNQYVQLVSVSRDPDDNLDKEDCLVVGWGRKNPKKSGATPILQQAHMEIVPTDKCYYKSYMTRGHVCVKDANPGTKGHASTCSNDSGGPMMCGKDFKTLKGVLSYGNWGCDGRKPQVFTKVSEYIDWMEQHGALPASANNCYVGKPENYRGTVNVTRGGITCQRWASHQPHQHRGHNDRPGQFIDGVMPENYCRNILGKNFEPWCYTIDPAKRWDYCDVTKCTN